MVTGVPRESAISPAVLAAKEAIEEAFTRKPLCQRIPKD
jgi:hypothetical protein